MSSYNNLTLLGNLTFKPDLSFTANGTAVAKSRIAVNQVMTKKDKSQVKETLFIDLQIWNKQAENCAEYLDKGSLVLVSGRLKFDQWKGADGEPHSKYYVVCDQVVFLTRSGSGKVADSDDARTDPKALNQDPKEPPADQPEDTQAPGDDDIPF